MSFELLVHGTPEAYRPRYARPVGTVESMTETEGISPITPDSEGGGRPHSRAAEASEAYERSSKPSPDARRQVILARDIMTSPVESLPPEATLDHAWEQFRTMRYRHFPVVDDGRLLGILSDRDLLREGAGRSGFDGDRPVSEVMVARVVVARPNAPIRDVVRAMFGEQIGAMPIMDELGQLIGILTRSDILRAVMNHPSLDLWA